MSCCAENDPALAPVHISSATDRKAAWKLWRVVVLLGISVFINYLDRGSLSVAAPLLKDELGLSASKLGILLSSFFWTYSSFQLVAGWLVDRFEVGWVMAVGFFLWSAATTATGVVHGFVLLLAARLVLGMGESVSFPACSNILARYFPEEQRGFANSVVVFGFATGPAISMFLGGMAMARFGWRPFFVVVGLLSLLWLVPWLAWMPRGKMVGPGPAVTSTYTRIPTREILRQRSAWGSFAGLFCSNYLSYFLLTWMPFLLVRERSLSLQQMAKIAGGCYLSAAVVALICGRLSDWFIVNGASPTRVRKAFTGTGMASAAIALVGCAFGGPTLSIVMLVMATVSYGITCSNVWAITQTLAGPAAAGRWTGLQNFMGNLAGILAPALTGIVVDRTGHFFWAFAITACVSLLGSIAYIFAIGPVEPVIWNYEKRLEALS
jgi:ACS family D-galactonate transporter-like MFS transporter